MNGLSFSELCCLFCCPPCPGRIAAKLAFLPPEPTYQLVPTEAPGDGKEASPDAAKETAAGGAKAASAAGNNVTTTTSSSSSKSAKDTARSKESGGGETQTATATTTTTTTSAKETAAAAAPAVAAATANANSETTATGGHKSSKSKRCKQHSTSGGGGGGGGGAWQSAGPGTGYRIVMLDRAEWAYSDREKDKVEGFYATTSRGNRIACMHIRCTPHARYTLLFSHGNAVDLGQMSSFYLGLGARINCNIFSYDYSGYGASEGKPSEKNLYADIDAAYHALRSRYAIPAEQIILYGQSIGTVPTVDLATRHEVGAVILHSPLMSGMRVAFPNTKRTWFFDVFPTIDKVPKVQSPVLVIHGTDDEVIDFSHGISIYERCPKAVEPLWVEGAGHNDVELYNQYLERLKQFLTVELVN